MTTVDRIAAALMLGHGSRSLLTRHARRYENVGVLVDPTPRTDDRRGVANTLIGQAVRPS